MKNSCKQVLACILALWIGGFILCCKQPEEKRSEKVLDKPHEKAIDDGQNNFQSYIFVDSVQALSDINREALPFDGRLLSAVSWNDQLGSNILILSEKGKYDEGNGRKELFAYHYIQRDTLYNVLWQINDFIDGLGCDLNIQLIHYFPLISDINSNGIAETGIFYSLNNRCDAVAFPAKILVHEGDNMFAIRGIREQYLNPPEEVNNQYRADEGLPPLKYKNVDRGHEVLDTTIINFYSHQWDSFIALENRLEGALPESLIKTIN